MRVRSLLVLLAAFAVVSSGGCKRTPEAVAPPGPMSVTPTTPPSPSPLPDPLPEVVAKVNDRPVPLRSARIIVQQQLAGRVPGDAERANLYRQAVEQLVARELLYQEAVRRGIQPDGGAVERLRKQVRSEYKTEKQWKEFLASQGLDAKSFVEELRVRSMVELLLRKEAESTAAEIPEAEARAYYAANPHLFESAGRPLPFENVRDRILSQLVTFKRSEALNTLLTGLRSAARIETYL
jgi:SurA N-terminal domain